MLAELGRKKSFMAVKLLGLGTAVPEVRIDQADAADLTASFNARSDSEHRVLRELYRRSGVKSRHSVILQAAEGDLAARQSIYHERASDTDFGPATSIRMAAYAEHAGKLATQAAQQALSQASCEPGQITHLVTASCTGFVAPGFDIEVMQALSLKPSVPRTHIGFMGCHSAMNSLRVADAYARSSPAARVLVVCSELCSLHHQYGWSPDRIVSNALFADGAGAVIVGELADSEHGSRSANRALTYRGNGSLVVPGTLDEMTWRVSNHGFEMTLSARVPDLIRAELRPWITTWLSGFELALSDIAGWAIHPGGPRILSASAEALGLERSQLSCSDEVLAEFGNMSSPTVLFIVDRLQQKGIDGPIVMLAFGPGLTIEAALLG